MWDLRLAMLEGRFSKRINSSRKPMMDFTSDMIVGSPHGHYYETIPNAESLPAQIRRLGAKRRLRWLYIAAHGTRRGVLACNDETTPLGAIADALNTPDGFEGAFFSCCRFVTARSARRLLLQDQTSLEWVAGYEKIVDWVHAAAIELYFWNWFLFVIDGGNTVHAVRTAALRLDHFMPGAHVDEGLQIYVRVGDDVEALLGHADVREEKSVVAQLIQAGPPTPEQAGSQRPTEAPVEDQGQLQFVVPQRT